MTGERMRAVQLMGVGGFDKLVYTEEAPKPVLSDGEALIRVAACGLNNTDVNTRTGWYAADDPGATQGASGAGAGAEAGRTWGTNALAFPRIQGADVCGRVEAVGAGVDPALMGRRALIDVWLRDWSDPDNLAKTGYFGSEIDGGFADYAKVDARNVHPIESALSDAELATFATSYITAENMLRRADVGAGDTVLIPGASGGVGSALIQLAHRRGAETVALCSEDKREAVAALGCRAVLPRSPEDVRGALRDAIGQDLVSVVADAVGGPLWPQLIDCLARRGRYTCAGAIAGPHVTFDLRRFYLCDLTLVGATIVPPGVFGDLVGYIERGEIKPLLAAAYPLADLRSAQEAFLAKRHVGNIVVTM